jgi:hypothetical protein
MPDNVNLHWTEDEDLLSLYVLNRLSAEERKKLEVHLVSCLHCREAVRQERELVSGIRQFGREEVKSRLKRQLAQKSYSYHRLISWQRVLSAAAVMFVVVGLGIYNRWFSWGERKNLPTTQEMHEPEKVLTENAHKIAQSKQKETTTAEEQIPLKTLRDDKADEKHPTEQIQSAQSSVAVSKTQSGQNESVNKLENTVAAPSSGGGGISLNKDIGKVKDQIGAAQSGVKQFWIEGIVLQEQGRAVREGLSLDKMSASKRNMPKSKKSSEQIGRQPSAEEILTQNEIRISQQYVRLLPPARQKLQQVHGQAIQTSVQQSDRGTTLTMYLDTLFNDEDLRNAKVEEILPDSLVIEVESRKIGFKIPVNVFDLQKGSQKAKEK